ncbi:MAG: hypothetical protein A2V72_02920 [Candidatus Nealsonbacteria bacterium RBG_13_37_56]|uniref:Uncharacterized protein n=1 Tax=Candidatus Nealsonbacteria bacterium RBG_13_37_56 TaxID=1801661 RepID=A0A1G2DWF1_9BACT|nr:MAG: hypothetical protein A2V72_02920 [Candidatus Nealsonbacteria bacterium RBG_13_37_56]
MLKFFIQRKKAFGSAILLLALSTNLIGSAVFAQGMGFFPEYPSRLRYLAEELNQSGQNLVYLNEELRNEAARCSCQNAKSQCGQDSDGNIQVYSPDVFGDPCLNREEIEQIKADVKNEAEQVSFLKDLLKQEMAAGIEAELKTLREDEANELRTGLDNLIAYSEEINASAMENIEALDGETHSSETQCNAECGTGSIFELRACIFGSVGTSDPITMEFEVGAGLTDLDLGEVRIDELELNLPSRIEISGIGSVGDFRINLNDVVVDFPELPAADLGGLNLGSIVLHPSSPDIPVISPVDFSCANFSASAYQCQKEEEPSGYYLDLGWYLQTFSWLSEKCSDLPTMKDENGILKEEIEQCFDKENVHLTIIKDCNLIWQEYLQCIEDPFAQCDQPAGICGEINGPETRNTAISRKCQDLFRQENEPVPGNCNLASLENKCSQIKEEGREEIPESCKFLPLFTGEIEIPEGQNYELSGENCSAQTISDIPESAIRLDCPSLPAIGSATLPKIKLPSIIIPDIRLPDFSFMPFIRVNLPDFIFEDLIFPDLNLCDFDACQNIIEPMKIDFQYPSLMIPDVEIPPLYISLADIFGAAGIGLNPLAIEMDDIEFPPIPFGLSGFNLNNYISFNIDLPEISLPRPEIILNFNGVKINAFDILLGLVGAVIPIPGGCIGVIGGISGIPLVIGFPDYYFSWPKFPEIPNLCDNEYINLNSFCQKIESSLIRDITRKIDEIETIINRAVQTQLQNRLDRLAVIFEQTIRESILGQLEEIKDRIEQEIRQSVAMATVENGMLKIPKAIVPLDNITVLMDRINRELSRIPLEVNLAWPANLKRIPLTDPISYQLPSIPLSGLSFTKSILIKLPGFQLPAFNFNIGISYPSCESESPSGGNPYPMGQINNNLGAIININEGINAVSNQINDILY